MRHTLFNSIARLALFAFVVALSIAPVITRTAHAQTPKVLSVQATVTAPLPPGSSGKAQVQLKIADGFHINSHPASEDYLIPVEVTLSAAPGITVGAPRYPLGSMVKFVFAARPVSVYRDKVVVTIPLQVAASAAPGMRNLRGRVHYQACNERSCLIPADASFELSLVVGNARADYGGTALTHDNAGGWGRRLQNASLFWQLVLAFIGGLLLNLTPCVYPMIPITLGYFGAQSEGRIGKTFGLAVFYVLGLSIVYSLLGVFAARTGALFGSTLQNPYVVGAVALVLFALGLSMIGAFTLQPPRFLLNRSGAKKGAWGALGMGALLGIVAAPCVGPVVAALLTYVGARGDMLLGFALFFALSLGLGLPYLVLGALGGALKSLPRSGAWLERSKKFFAVPLLLAAVYYGFSAVQTIRMARPAAPGISETLRRTYRVTGLPTLVFIDANGHERLDLRAGEELTVAGMLQKLAALENGKLPAPEVPGAPPTAATATAASRHWPDATVQSVKAAAAQHRPVVLDFRADWCLPCRKMEREIFSRPDFVAAARGIELLRVDLTTANG